MACEPSPAYILAVSTLVGREPELAEVADFLRADEAEAALAIVGEPGIGKTAVWEEAVRLARELDALVLAARPAESEATLSFAGLTDLLAELDPLLFEGLPPPQRHALEVAVLRTASERPAGRRLVGTALLSLLRSLAEEQQVVLAVDDAHWLDAPSAAALAFATRRLAGDPVRVIVSLRSETERLWLGTTGLGREVRRLELGPLSVASLHRVIADRTGRSFPRPTLVRIAQVSGGNPLYALEVAQLLAKDNERDYRAALPVPADLQELVVRRLAALPAKTRAALLRVAALARPTVELVDVDALAPAEEAGLVRVGLHGRVEFTHPLFASAVYTSAPRAQRREAHAALAETVGDPEERAHHLALAADGPDEQVAQALEDAGRSARRRGAPDVAAHLTELALKLAPEDDPRRAERRLELAEHLHLAGDFQRAGELLGALERELPPGDLRARALLLLAEIDYWRAGESAAGRLAEQAAGEAKERSLRARCHAFVAIWAGTADVPRAAEAARASLELLDDGDADPALLSLALGARVRADLFLGHGLDLEAAKRALEAELAGPPPPAVDTRMEFKLGQWLRYVDDLDGSRLRLDQAERQAREEGDESSFANILLNRTLLECWAGDWPAALELADRTHETFQLTGVEVESRLWRAYVEAHFGRVDQVRAASAAQTAASEPVVRMLWERSLGLAALAAGEPAAADRHLRAAMELLEQMGWREPAVWRVEGDAIEAALGVGDQDRAAGLVDRFEQQAQCSGIPWSLAGSARCRGLLLAAEGQLDASVEALERALREHERSPVPFERARTLLAYGQVLRRTKQKRKARAALEEAATLFERLGAEPWAARTHEELRRTAARAAPTGLSATELKIARLAADGLTNRAIAAEVFVSPKTVEANLGRVYRKLGIRSRAQLARALEAGERQPIS
jgi:DNA-binding CsgD family transcriptional regulator